MRSISTLLATGLLAITAHSAHSQAITLTNTGYEGPGMDTSAKVTNMAAYASYATPQTNGMWDLASAAYENMTYFRERYDTSASPFPDAEYATLVTYPFGGLGYSTNLYHNIDNAGITLIGENKFNKLAIGIGAQTGNPNDSLIFPPQTIEYSVPQTFIPFPATMGDEWMANLNFTTDFNLTVTAYGLSNVPGERRSTRMTTDSVVGWGKMRLRDRITGDTSAWMDVLQVHTHEAITDSFYLNGSPAPDMLVSAFGLAQGQVSHAHQVNFYRIGELEPLALLEYAEAAYSGTPTKMWAHQSRLEKSAATGVHDIAFASGLRAYPNPVSDGILHLNGGVGLADGAAFTLMNALGNVAASGMVKNGQVDLGKGLPAGPYFLRVQVNGKNPPATLRVVVR